MVRGSSSCRNDVHSLDLKRKVRISIVPLSSDVKRIEDVACVIVPAFCHNKGNTLETCMCQKEIQCASAMRMRGKQPISTLDTIMYLPKDLR